MSKRDSGVRRLLVITYHFPPDGTVGGLRWAGLSKYLARLGWEVHVVTAAAPDGGADSANVHRHVRQRRRTLNDVYRDAMSRFRQNRAASQKTGPPKQALQRPRSPTARGLSMARRAVASAMYLPDHGRGWVLRAAAAARALMQDRRFDVVVTSGPPHSAHVAGLLATRNSDTRFWIDMRDPWSITHEGHTPVDALIRAERSLLAWVERVLFPHAEKLVVNTREFASTLRSTRPKQDVVYFPNGIDLEQLPARDPRAVEVGTIAYVGALYAGRNLSSVFAAMSALLKERPESARTLRLNVAGPHDRAHGEQMHESIAATGVGSVVKILGSLPRAEALDLLNRSHLALVLAQDQCMQVPAKLYECVGLGVATLVVAEKGSAAACEAHRIGAMTVDGDDVEGIRAVLEDLIAGRIPTTVAPAAAISYADLAVEMDRLLRGANRPAG